jgi:hypothetical protein
MDQKKTAKSMKPYQPRSSAAKADKVKDMGMKKGGMVTKGCGMARPQKFRVM